jgi:hypothetical protein
MTLFFVRDFFGFYNTFVHFFFCLLFCFFLLFSLRKFSLLSMFSLSVLKFSFFSHIPFYTYILVSFHICSFSRHYFCSLLSSFLSLFTLFNSLTSIFYSLCFLLSSLPFSLCFTFVCVNVKRKSFLLYFIQLFDETRRETTILQRNFFVCVPTLVILLKKKTSEFQQLVQVILKRHQ